MDHLYRIVYLGNNYFYIRQIFPIHNYDRINLIPSYFYFLFIWFKKALTNILNLGSVRAVR